MSNKYRHRVEKSAVEDLLPFDGELSGMSTTDYSRIRQELSEKYGTSFLFWFTGVRDLHVVINIEARVVDHVVKSVPYTGKYIYSEIKREIENILIEYTLEKF